jgi:hypothetical protein
VEENLILFAPENGTYLYVKIFAQDLIRGTKDFKRYNILDI